MPSPQDSANNKGDDLIKPNLDDTSAFRYLKVDELFPPDRDYPSNYPLNFHQVNEWLYRGGRPNRNDMTFLMEKDIQTVVSLRRPGAEISQEEQIVLDMGRHFVAIPLSYWSLPTLKQVETFMEVLDDVSRRPVYVHCYHGVDRTGFCIAMYRIMRCGWTYSQAYDEMRRMGHHRFTTAHYRYGLWLLDRKLRKAK